MLVELRILAEVGDTVRLAELATEAPPVIIEVGDDSNEWTEERIRGRLVGATTPGLM